MSSSASQIPNLNTLRSQLGRGRGRGRGRGLGVSGDESNSSQEAKEAHDRIIQQTDQDASVARISAVELGYLDDPFASSFLTPGVKAGRRLPIINRGTYVRTTAIDCLVHLFLNSSTGPSDRRQIISLGAGSDTRFFRLLTANSALPLIYHELDFPAVTARKVSAIQQSPHLLSLIQQSTSNIQPLQDSKESQSQSPLSLNPETGHLRSPSLTIHPLDLALLPTTSLSSLPNISPNSPTLILSECCLCYLPTHLTRSILNHLLSYLHPQTGIIIYEPTSPHDAFGRVMTSNLSSRGITLPTLAEYDTLSAQRKRLSDAGFTGQAAGDVEWLWRNWLDESEKARVGRVEMLDEVEEWELLGRHYCVVWGWRDGRAEGSGDVWSGWRDVQGQE